MDVERRHSGRLADSGLSLVTLAFALATATLILGGACAPEDGDIYDREFDDFTFSGPITRELFFEDARLRPNGTFGLKFVIQFFDVEEFRRVVFFRRDAYRFHDEWYWFRLLNGRPAPGVASAPVEGLRLSDVDDAYAWAREQAELPLALRWTDGGDRLVSDRFYVFAHTAIPRRFGAGQIIATEDDRWMFQLSGRDPVSYDELDIFLRSLSVSLLDIGELKWLPSGELHDEVVAEMTARGRADEVAAPSP